MFFEGSEKKVEIQVCQSVGSLRGFGRAFWEKIVACANAEIISSINNDQCDAYLLSESSLFVWDNHFLMLTCGTTTLADAMLAFVEHVGADNISFACYQRKNEYLSHLQSSSFEQDLSRIRQHIQGKAYRIGHLDAHHHYVFCSEPSTPSETAITNDLRQGIASELLMYHIHGAAADYLRSDQQTAAGVRDVLHLEQLFPEFIFDDFLFQPFGYSINGLCGEHYLTIHITPQENSSYVSFETNLELRSLAQPVLGKLLQILNPSSWDVIGFNAPHETTSFPAHFCLGSCNLASTQGYQIQFSHYQQISREELIPELL